MRSRTVSFETGGWYSALTRFHAARLVAAFADTNSQLLDLVAGLEVTQQLPVLPVLCALTIPQLGVRSI